MACTRETLGGNLSFHCVDGKGYSTDVRKAELYTLSEAQKAWEFGRDIDLPISADHIDANLIYRVDCQLLPTESSFEGDKFVVFKESKWAGNDVYWISYSGLTTEIDKAAIYSKNEAKMANLSGGVVVVPLAVANQNKRPTFAAEKLNRRIMIQGAGLKTPDHIKRSIRRSRRNTGKVRFNCPCCGKINWQYNPYDFDGCSDVFCDEHKY